MSRYATLRTFSAGVTMSLAALLVLCAPAHADSILLDHAQMVGMSERVVHATVSDVEARPWGPHEVPSTWVTVQVHDAWKGADDPEVTFVQSGGTLDGVTMEPSGFVAYTPGDEVVLFLERTRMGPLVTVGADLGAFEVVDGRLDVVAHPAAVHHSARAVEVPTGQRPYGGMDLAEARARVIDHRAAPRPRHVPR